jgi:hypothetical protein
MLAVKSENPGIDLRLLFQRTNRKGQVWCNKHGFKWAVKFVPDEWLKENQ